MSIQWLIALLILPFMKGCVFPGWASASEFAFSCLLVGFLSYFKPRTPLESEQLKRIDELDETVKALRDSLAGLKIKIGIRER